MTVAARGAAPAAIDRVGARTRRRCELQLDARAGADGAGARVRAHRLPVAVGSEGLLGDAGGDEPARRDAASSATCLRRVVQGGGDYGNLTLTHFYALHTMLLPALTIGARGRARALVRGTAWRRGGPTTRRRDAHRVRAVASWRSSATRSCVRSHGAPLEAPADPSSAYDARPEWYFLPLFQLLKYLPGRMRGHRRARRCRWSSAGCCSRCRARRAAGDRRSCCALFAGARARSCCARIATIAHNAAVSARSRARRSRRQARARAGAARRAAGGRAGGVRQRSDAARAQVVRRALRRLPRARRRGRAERARS